MNKEENERITYEEFMIMFKNAPRFAYMLYDKAEDEIDKLNNVINELKKYIRNYINLMVNNPDIIEQGQLDILYEVLDKLKELKENK